MLTSVSVQHRTETSVEQHQVLFPHILLKVVFWVFYKNNPVKGPSLHRLKDNDCRLFQLHIHAHYSTDMPIYWFCMLLLLLEASWIKVSKRKRRSPEENTRESSEKPGLCCWYVDWTESTKWSNVHKGKLDTRNKQEKQKGEKDSLKAQRAEWTAVCGHLS